MPNSAAIPQGWEWPVPGHSNIVLHFKPVLQDRRQVTLKDAEQFVDLAKTTLNKTPGAYDQFGTIMMDFKKQTY